MTKIKTIAEYLRENDLHDYHRGCYRKKSALTKFRMSAAQRKRKQHRFYPIEDKKNKVIITKERKLYMLQMHFKHKPSMAGEHK